MTELVKKKEELKKKIRSLLLSAPLGLTLEELIKDYHSFIGERLPTRDLGYSSVEELLQDIPDVVQMTKKNDVLILKAVSDASTQNIEKLVSRQKLDNKKRWGVLSMGTDGNRTSKGRGRRLLSSHGSSGDNHHMKEGSTYFTHHSRGSMKHARHRNMPVVPAYVRGQIHELVKKHPSGIPLTHISNIFYKHYGLHLDHQSMGFSSEYDLFASLADIVSLRKFSFGEVRLMSIESALALDGGHNRQRQLCVSDSKLKTDIQPASTEICQKDKPGTKPESAEMCQRDAPDTRPASAEMCQKDIPNIRPVPKSLQTEPDPGAGDPNKSQNSQHLIDLCIECDIPEPVQNNIRQIMSERPNGIYASRLPFQYKSMFKKDLPYKTYGYNSIIEFAADLTHIVRIERPDPRGDWHLLPANSERTTEGPTVSITRQQDQEDANVKLEIDKSTQEVISQVLSMNRDGILLERFENVYKVMTGQTLDYVRHGARDLKQFLHAMPDVLISSNMLGKDVVCQKVIAGDFTPRRFDRLQDQYQPTAALGNKLDKPVLHLPSDAVSPGCCYSPQPMPVFQDESKYIDLYVSYVTSPDLFWVQLRGKETTLALEDVMDEIEKVYRSKHLPPDYEMTASLAKPGMICAAIFPEDGHWYRAIITDVMDQLYEVCYVDYGNVCSVSISSLRLLKTKFLKFPVQAIRARLSNIRPVDGVWRVNSKIRLLELCREKPLVGFVTNIKDGVMSLCLTDTTNEYDIHINDVFVNEGYATLSPDHDQTDVISHATVPSRELLFGENALSTGQDSSPPVLESRRYIRQVQMTDDILMNLIHLDGQLYILSAEISHLFFSEDVLSAQLCKDNVDISKVVVTRRNEPGLFNELAIYGAPNFNDSTNILSLFPLSELPLIISLYGKDGQLDEVKATALEVLNWFNPDDPYWRCDDDACPDGSSGVDTHSSVGDASDMPGLDDLQLVHSSLVIKRTRILQQMLAGKRCKPSNVNDLNDVEWDIARVEALISKLQNLLGRAASAQSCVSGGLTDSGMCLPSEEKCDVQLPPMSAQLKSTQRVAPTVHSSSTVPELSAGAVGAAADMAKLLEERLMLNTLLLEQLHISQEALAGQSLSSCGQGTNRQQQQQQQLLQQQLLQAEWQKGNPAVTTVTHSTHNPLLSLGHMPASSYTQLTAPLAASTPGPGTVTDPSVSSSFLGSVRGRLPLDVYGSQLQQFTSSTPQPPHLQCLLQNHSPGQDCGLLHSQQSPNVSHTFQQSPNASHILQQSHLGSHVAQLPPSGSHILHQFQNLNARVALDFNRPNMDSLQSLQFAHQNSLPTSQFEEFVGPTSFILPGQHQGMVPTSWYTAQAPATSMPLLGSMAAPPAIFPSSMAAPQAIFPSSMAAPPAMFPSASLNYSFGVVPPGSVLLQNRLPQQTTHSVAGCPDLMSLFLSSQAKDVEVFTTNTNPGSGV